MFTNISWKEFALFIAAFLLIYYLWLLVIFFAKDILKLFNKKKTSEEKNFNESDEILSVVYTLQDEIKAAIEEAGQEKIGREEIILLLKALLQKYSLHATPFRLGINHFIERLCQNICSIHLNREEVEELWAG